MPVKLLFVLILISSCLYASNFTEPYTQEIAGMGTATINTQRQGNLEHSGTTINLTSAYHFYILNNLYLGPSIHYSHWGLTGDAIEKVQNDNFGIGLNVGIAKRLNPILIPFAQFNYSHGIDASSQRTSNGTTSDRFKNNGNSNQAAIDIGLKLEIIKHVAINITTGYTYEFGTTKSEYQLNNSLQNNTSFDYSNNYFRVINFGISGLIYK